MLVRGDRKSMVKKVGIEHGMSDMQNCEENNQGPRVAPPTFGTHTPAVGNFSIGITKGGGYPISKGGGFPQLTCHLHSIFFLLQTVFIYLS